MSIDSLFRLFLNDSMNPTSSNDVSICLTTEGKPFWQTFFANYSLFTRKNYQEGILDEMNQVIGLPPEMPSYFIYQCNSVIRGQREPKFIDAILCIISDIIPTKLIDYIILTTNVVSDHLRSIFFSKRCKKRKILKMHLEMLFV